MAESTTPYIETIDFDLLNVSYYTQDSFQYHSVTDLTWVKTLIMVLYGSIFALGMGGNVLVMVVVLKKKSMRTVTNLLITNLSAADLVLCLLSITLTSTQYLTGHWVFGEVMCYIFPLILYVVFYVSTMTSSVIAINRFFAIVYPFKPQMTVFTCLVTAGIIWVFAIIASLPKSVHGTYHVETMAEYVDPDAGNSPITSTVIAYCYENWPSKKSRQIFTVITLLLQYFLPCVVITFCYSVIWYTLRVRSKTPIGAGMRSHEQDEREMARKRRTNQMLVAMVVIFLICWTPISLSWLLQLFWDYEPYWNNIELIYYVCHVIAMSSTIYNPFLYACLNESFRREFGTALSCFANGCCKK